MIGNTKSCYSVRATCIQDVARARVCQHVLRSVRAVRETQGSIYVVAIAGPRELFSMENYLRCIHCIKARGMSMIFCMCL